MTDLTDLIARLEAATEGSRELDARIKLAAGLYDHMKLWPDCTLEIGQVYRDGQHELLVHSPNGGAISYSERPPHYTTSIDAALTLVPEDREWGVGDDKENSKGWAAVSDDHWDEAMGDIKAVGATPALALCIAALKARSAACPPAAELLRGKTNDQG